MRGVDEPAVLLVEEDPNVANLVDRSLRRGGYHVYRASPIP